MNTVTRFLHIVFLLFSLTAYGQKVTDTIRIREVEVIGERHIQEAGLKVTRPDSMARAFTLTTDLSELLSDFSPVFIKSYGRGSPATASFRGTSSSHTQIFWNGINLNSPMRGVADLSLLPVFFTDDVYLLHGGSSLAKGSGALGGSIILDNKPDWSARMSAEALLEKGSFGTNKSFGRLLLGGRNYNINTRVFYEDSRNNFSFLNTGVIPHRKDTLKNSGYSAKGILQELYFRKNNEDILTFRWWYQQSRRDLPQLMSYEGSSREENQDDRQLRGQVDWKKYSANMNCHFFSGFNSNILEYYRASPEFNFINENSKSREFSIFNHFRLRKELSPEYYAIAGIDANYHKVKAKDLKRSSGYNNDRLEAGFMLNLHLIPVESIKAYLLVRSEYYDRKIVPLIPSAGLEWQFQRDLPLLLSLNAARNYHKPSLNDLYWLPGGNPDLLPEDGYTGDITLSGNFNPGSATVKSEITGFLSKIENWIIWQPSSGGAYYWEADNVKNVLSKGIEYNLSVNYKWKKILFYSGGNYSFTNTSNINAVSSADASRGKQLIYIPKHKGNYFLSITWSKFTTKYDLNFVGKRYTKSSNVESPFEQVLNPYFLSRIAFDKQMDLDNISLNLKITIENIFDKTYQSILWRPMPGRFYSFSVAINYSK